MHPTRNVLAKFGQRPTGLFCLNWLVWVALAEQASPPVVDSLDRGVECFATSQRTDPLEKNFHPLPRHFWGWKNGTRRAASAVLWAHRAHNLQITNSVKPLLSRYVPLLILLCFPSSCLCGAGLPPLDVTVGRSVGDVGGAMCDAVRSAVVGFDFVGSGRGIGRC